MSNNGKIPGGRMRAPFRGSSLAGRTRVAGCRFLLGLGSLSSHPTDPQAFLPPHSTVVLLAGLPGDLESDNTYRDQLQTWLEIVQVSGAADRIFVLSDNAESVILPEKNNASTNYHSPLTIHDSLSTLLHADRTNFLALGQTLAGATNPLVVIAWGHGGRQGATPVLHVRGPRLTPADFKAVGGQAMESQSRWVLLFRGSGAFAKQLAAEHRQILSSERDTMFTSDPVGMSLLLKLARADPATSFEKLTEAFGQATAAWYTERKLARTEEPTLWTANEPPRLLATASETNS